MKRMCRVAVVAVAALAGLAAGPSQQPVIHDVMRDKLVEAQKILEAVVTSNWTALDAHTVALEQLTNDPRWMVLKYPEYGRHSGEFVRQVRALRQAGAKHDLNESSKAYGLMTVKCVDCHRYLARVRNTQ